MPRKQHYYAATALSVARASGLFHLQGSMHTERSPGRSPQKRWRSVDAPHSEHIHVKMAATGVVLESEWRGLTEPADHVVANVTVQNLLQLLGEKVSKATSTVKNPQASGAFVVYLGVDESAIPPGCPPHLQFSMTLMAQ